MEKPILYYWAPGDANKIPYLYVGGELIEGQEAVLAKLEAMK